MSCHGCGRTVDPGVRIRLQLPVSAECFGQFCGGCAHLYMETVAMFDPELRAQIRADATGETLDQARAALTPKRARTPAS